MAQLSRCEHNVTSVKILLYVSQPIMPHQTATSNINNNKKILTALSILIDLLVAEFRAHQEMCFQRLLKLLNVGKPC